MKKSTVVRRVLPLILLVMLVGTALMRGPAVNRTEAAPAPAALPAQSGWIYLPLIMSNPIPNIYGVVSLGGVPAPGVGVTLLLSTSGGDSPLMTQTTSSDGTYRFYNAPGLAAGQRYYVQYLRPLGVTNTLRSWSTKPFSSYAEGETKAGGDFDIADVVLLQPPADAAITLPYTFTWNVRPATPTETYKLQVNDPTTGQAWWTSDDLGYSGSYVMNTLPLGINPGSLATWSVIPIAPDGGNGRSSTRKVTFQ